MTNAEFEGIYPIYKNDIRAIARKLAKRDNDLFEDLCSIGSIALWNLDLSKATQNVPAFVKSAIKARMIDFLRKERSYSKESLNTLLALGHQVTEGPAGDPMLIRAPKKRSRAHPADGDPTWDETTEQYSGDDD